MMIRRFRVLLIEDDEDDYVFVKDVLSKSTSSKFDLDWKENYEKGLSTACRSEHDVVLLDYRLGDRNGLELLRETRERGCELPFILLTGQGGYDVDIEAMEAGASDYLVKGEISPDTLERTIRYSIDRKHTERELRRANEMLREEIEERRRAERALRLDESRLEALLSLSQMAGASVEQIIDFVIEEQVKLTGSTVGWLGFINEDETNLSILEWSKEVLNRCKPSGEKMLFSIDSAGIWADAVRERKTLVINDYSAPNPHKLGYPQGHLPLRRLLVSPVFEGDRIIAVAAVANKDEDYDATDVRQHALLLDGMWKLIQRERAMKALLESESLAAMGRALSSVAHDMKTPLIAIGGFTLLAKNHMAKTNPYRQKLDIVIKETQRLEAMVKDMLDFSRPLVIDRSPGDVDKIVDESLILLDSMAKECSVGIRSAIENDLPPVFFDPLRIKQVLINLAANAVQASPEGGMVIIRAYASRTDLIIDVIDHGPGIELEKRGTIFSPFFTTKKEGTGLGLSIVKKVVEAHRGRVDILDNSAEGVTFRVVLPDCVEEKKAGKEASLVRAPLLGMRQKCYGARIGECAA